MDGKRPLRLAVLALKVSAMVYALAWAATLAAKVLTFGNPSAALIWDYCAESLRFWMPLAIGLSAIACGLIRIGIREQISRKSWISGFWIGGTLVGFVVLPFTLLLWGFLVQPVHIRNQALLRAINAEARMLIARKLSGADDRLFRQKGYINLPKSQWPPAIAALSPEFVTVDHASVDVLTEIFFDGGFGYLVQPGIKAPPEPVGRFQYLGEDVYAYHPY